MSDPKSHELNLREEFPPVPDVAWRAAVDADLKGADFDRKLVWQTREGIPVQPYYRQGALDGIEYLESVPGQAPWLRGRSADGNAWRAVQEISNADASAANSAARKALENGADGVCFLTEAAPAGVRGVNLQTLGQMRALIHDLPLYKAGIHFRAGGNALPVLANFMAALKAVKADSRDVQGSVDYDPLMHLAVEGEITGSREEMFFELASVLEESRTRMPDFKVLSLQAAALLEAGGGAVQEIAFTLAALAEYLAGLKERGQSPARVLSQVKIAFGVGSVYFFEIAKLRAARLLLSRVAEAFLPEGEAAPHIPIEARTANYNKSVYDPHTNLLRATTEAMAAAIGGADLIIVSPFDSLFRAPGDHSQRLSRNIQLVLKHEAYLDQVADPAAGSYLFETLTDSLAKSAWELFQKVEGMGGFLAAASNGFLKNELARVAAERRQAIASRKQALLGVNQYPNLNEKVLRDVDFDALLNGYARHERPFKLSGDSILDSLISAYEEGSVLNDAIEALSWKDRLLAQPVHIARAARPFEEIRLATEKFEQRTGGAPKVFLFKIGDLAMRQARAAFVTNFFGCAGFHILDNPGFDSVESAVEAAAAGSPQIVALCSADEEYVALAREACPKLRAAIPGVRIAVAGLPKEGVDTLKELGVDDFVHARTVAQDALALWQERLGVVEAVN